MRRRAGRQNGQVHHHFAFDVATHVESDGSTQIHDGWDIYGNANGGYLMALAAQHMRAVSGRPDPISVTAHYLAPGSAGPATVDAELVKAGRRFATVSARLSAGGRPVLQLVGAFGDLAANDSHTFEYVTETPPDLPPFDECPSRSAEAAAFQPALMSKLDMRMHPDHLGWVHGQRNGVAEMAGWFAFADGRPIDTLALLLACDAFPPNVFHLDIPGGWAPTVEFTVHVRAIPAPGPLRCIFRSQFVTGGFMNSDGEVWDSTDRLVAQSRQLGLLPQS